MQFEGKRRVKFHLDIAPLVDIVFLLLIFFLLTSQFIKPPGLKIELPKAKYARAQDKLDIVVAVTKDEKVLLNGVLTNFESLPEQLWGILKDSPRKVIIIKADKDAKVQSIVTVMDIAKRCNAEGVTLSTKLKLKDEY